MDHELFARLNRLQHSIDILLEMEGIVFNPEIGDYVQEPEEEVEESGIVEERRSSVKPKKVEE